MADSFARGMIVAYYARSGAIPAGWAICDGTNGTPDLRDRYLVGVDALGDVGKTTGSAQHVHTVSVQGTTADARAVADGWGFDSPDRSRTPQATGLDHTHGLGASGSTGPADNLPPSLSVIFLMRL
ncbi:MAG: hypothetical protein QOI11_870 [Candidatus Eremiobacteraeota bacterium]|nr:hypothetical protein [Candidatus Eremiobacteraeota bacterium]